jgi:hypothetical protein
MVYGCGPSDVICELVFPKLINKIVMPTTDGHGHRYGDELSAREVWRGGGLIHGFQIPTLFLDFLIVLSEPSIYSFESKRAQSFNMCKRVGMIYIP